jgi:predicted glutamine amidotransferase
MCQLLGMNCNAPTDVTFSFTGFAQRGGRTDEHADGWGIAFFEGGNDKGLRHFVDHQSACDSPVAELTLTLRELVPSIAGHGTFNFMLSNGQALWAHASTRLHYVERKHPFAHAQLSDEELSIDFAQYTQPTDRVAVVVTAPLTVNEAWVPFEPGQLKVFVDGVVAG